MVREDDIRGRAAVVVVIAIVFVVQYLASTQYDEVTGESHHFAYSVEKEIELGRSAAPKLIAQYGGEATGRDSDLVRSLGKTLVRTSIASKSKYPFEFHVLKDDATINAFVSKLRRNVVDCACHLAALTMLTLGPARRSRVHHEGASQEAEDEGPAGRCTGARDRPRHS